MDIVNNSSVNRIFYFHEFIYFIEMNNQDYSKAIDNIVEYFIDLLLIFDEILIPSEHLTISNSEYESNFKLKFLLNPTIKTLKEHKKIVTTIWSQCSDNIQHYENVERYMNIIGAKDKYYFQKLKNEILNLEIYQRDATHQSKKAKSYVINTKHHESLIYEDNDILINFSHEKLLLGDAKKQILDNKFITEAKEAYINAMPDGNGRVYRSLIFSMEVSYFHNVKKYNPINCPANVNPVLFTYEIFIRIMHIIGFCKPIKKNYKNKIWLQWLFEFLNKSDNKQVINEIFLILEYLTSNFSLGSNEEINIALNQIFISHSKVGFREIILNIKYFFNIKNTYSKIFYIPTRMIEEYNYRQRMYNKS